MGTRTPDLLIANETLYQLSYTPNVLISVSYTSLSQSDKDACLYRDRPTKANGIARAAERTNRRLPITPNVSRLNVMKSTEITMLQRTSAARPKPSPSA